MKGRLTLQSGKPVQTADQSNKSVVYYAPYIGNTVPVYDGTVMQERVFTTSDTDIVGQSLTLDTNSAHTGFHDVYYLYDVFAFWTGTTVKIGTGPKYQNTGKPAGGLIQTFKGIDTNASTMSVRWGTGASDITSVPANQATWLGSIFLNTGSLMHMELHPAPATGGTQNFLCVWNRYNKVKVNVVNTDLTTSWLYSSSSVRMVNNSDKNRIWWVDGLGLNQVKASSTRNTAGNGTAHAAYTNGVQYNDYTNLSGGVLSQAALADVRYDGCISIGTKTGYSILGLNYVQELEQSTSVPMEVFGNDFGALEIELDM